VRRAFEASPPAGGWVLTRRPAAGGNCKCPDPECYNAMYNVMIILVHDIVVDVLSCVEKVLRYFS